MERELKPAITKKNHFKTVFDSFEVSFSDKKKKYFDKLAYLPIIWEKIWHFVSDPSSESPQPEFESLFMHTLRSVLIADWTHACKAIKTCLSINIHRVITTLSNSKNHSNILQQCRLLESVVNKPWEDEVLNKIFHSEEVDIDELIDYFHSECAKVIIVRLEILLDSKCEDFAIRLSKSFLWAYHCTDPLEFDLDQNQLNYITDIYYCCLFRKKNRSDLIAELKALNVSEGLQLLKRYRRSGGIGADQNYACKEARVWKSSRNAIESMSNTLLANAVLNAEDDLDVDILQDLLNEWVIVNECTLRDDLATVIELIRKSVMIAKCSKAMYPFCSFLIERFNEKCYLNKVLYCLIRTVNLNMNEIELHKVSGDQDKLKSLNEQLAKGFLIIANLLGEYKNIYRECMLTAFSLTPSRDFINDLERFVDTTSNVEYNVADEEKENEKPADHDDAKKEPYVDEKKGDETSDKIKADENKSDEAAPASSSGTAKPGYVTEIESLSIEESLKTDLNSILRFQRHQALTWDLPWDKLKMICENYSKLFEERGFGEIELKYLELDYNQFKDRPIDYEYGGIEKGYEHYMYLSPDENAAAADDSNVYESYSSSMTSSSDSDYKTSYKPRKKRKKKSKTCLKRLRRKVMYEEFGDSELNETEFNAIESSYSEGLNEAERRWLLSTGFRKIRTTTKKKKRNRLQSDYSMADTSDANVDSQAENKPPDENVALAGDDDSKNDDLRKLREYRHYTAMTPSNRDDAKPEPPNTKRKSLKNGQSIARKHSLKRVHFRPAQFPSHHAVESLDTLNDCLADFLAGIDDEKTEENQQQAPIAAATVDENAVRECTTPEMPLLVAETSYETVVKPVSIKLEKLDLDNLPLPVSSAVTPPLSPPTPKKKRRKSSIGCTNSVPEKTETLPPLLPVVCLPDISTQLPGSGTSFLYSDLRISQPSASVATARTTLSSYCESINPWNRSYSIVETKCRNLRVAMKCDTIGNNSHYCENISTPSTTKIENPHDVSSSSIPKQDMLQHLLNETRDSSEKKKRKHKEGDSVETKRSRKSRKEKTEKDKSKRNGEKDKSKRSGEKDISKRNSGKDKSKRNGVSKRKQGFLTQQILIDEALSRVQSSQSYSYDDRPKESYSSNGYITSDMAAATATAMANGFEQNGNVYSNGDSYVLSSMPTDYEMPSRVRNGLIALYPVPINQSNLIESTSEPTKNASDSRNNVADNNYNVNGCPRFEISDNYGAANGMYHKYEMADYSNFVGNGTNHVQKQATTSFKADRNCDLFGSVQENPSISVVAENSNAQEYYDNMLSLIEGNSLSQPNDDLYLRNDYNVDSQYGDGFINEYNAFKGDNFSQHNGFMASSNNYCYSNAAATAIATTATTTTNYADQIGNYRL